MPDIQQVLYECDKDTLYIFFNLSIRPSWQDSFSFQFVNDDNQRCIVQLIEHTIEMKIKISIEISLSLLSEHYKRNENCISNMLVIGEGPRGETIVERL